MKKYRVMAEVKSASGQQYFTVEAEDPEDAVRRYEAGESELEYQELEVTGLEDATVDGVQEIKDDGK